VHQRRRLPPSKANPPGDGFAIFEVTCRALWPADVFHATREDRPLNLYRKSLLQKLENNLVIAMDCVKAAASLAGIDPTADPDQNDILNIVRVVGVVGLHPELDMVNQLMLKDSTATRFPNLRRMFDYGRFVFLRFGVINLQFSSLAVPPSPMAPITVLNPLLSNEREQQGKACNHHVVKHDFSIFSPAHLKGRASVGDAFAIPAGHKADVPGILH
jgi:hypothetical protein